MARHELKLHPGPFRAVVCDEKTFEFRKDDRGFAVNDVLRLREWEPCLSDARNVAPYYTGAECTAVVKYIARAPAFDIPDGYVIMSIERGQPARGARPCKSCGKSISVPFDQVTGGSVWCETCTAGLDTETPRHETGVRQDPGDWPGIFIRGDDAFFYAHNLKQLDVGTTELNELERNVVRALVELLESCDVRRRRAP